jgi:hypothetical protein
MVSCIAGGAPDTCYTELATSAFFIVVGAINFAPGVGAACFYTPAMFFSILLCKLSFNETKRRFTQLPALNVFFWPLIVRLNLIIALIISVVK